MWKVPRIWEGGDVWILGGGPSVPKQFGIPEGVVQNVISGITPPSTYSPYMKAIHNKHIIGVNIAFMIGDWIDMVFFGDSGFFLRYNKELSEFPGLKVTCHHSAAKHPWVKVLDKDRKHPRGISTKPGQVSWNGNSGAAAINLAVHTGAKRIILLGFDMKLDDKTKMQHWHDVYKRGKVIENDTRRLRRLPFERHMKGFQFIAKEAKELGIEILNANPDSAIKEFPKYSLKELLFDNS